MSNQTASDVYKSAEYLVCGPCGFAIWETGIVAIVLPNHNLIAQHASSHFILHPFCPNVEPFRPTTIEEGREGDMIPSWL
jgi:hypothetical protein